MSWVISMKRSHAPAPLATDRHERGGASAHQIQSMHHINVHEAATAARLRAIVKVGGPVDGACTLGASEMGTMTSSRVDNATHAASYLPLHRLNHSSLRRRTAACHGLSRSHKTASAQTPIAIFETVRNNDEFITWDNWGDANAAGTRAIRCAAMATLMHIQRAPTLRVRFCVASPSCTFCSRLFSTAGRPRCLLTRISASALVTGSSPDM